MFFQLFIPGKNWRLSLAELITFLEGKKAKFEISSFSKEFFIVRLKERISPSIIDDLGGIIKIGDLSTKFSTEIIRRAILQNDKKAKVQIIRDIIASGLVDRMLESESEKILFGVSVYCAEKALRAFSRRIQRLIGTLIKRELLHCGRKSRFMGFAKNRKYPQLSHIEVLKKNLLENNAEALVCIGKAQTWISISTAVHNPFEFQKRDLYKPIQRKIFAMPPRIARIMVNLSFCSPEKLLLDPFCGVGTILQEALLEKAKVVGLDLNPWCIKATKENLEWLKKEYELAEAEIRVMQGDVQKLSEIIGQEQVDCLVTEPDLGPALRQIPTKAYAMRIIVKLEPLYYSLLKEAYQVLKNGGRMVIVSPCIKTRSEKPVVMRIEKMALEIGFEKVFPIKKAHFSEGVFVPEKLSLMDSFIDISEKHKIGRAISILKK